MIEKTLLVHIAAGTLSVAAGAMALAFQKGETAHRAAGCVFVAAMPTMAVSAAIVGRDDFANTIAAVLTIYAVATGWTAARRKEKTASAFEIAAAAVAAACATGGYVSAYLISSGAKAAANPYIVVAQLILSTVLALAALGDLSVFIRGGIAGRQRIARHLWRMCLGLVIAVGSFAAQGAQALPQWIPGGQLILFALAVVVTTMAFWLVRVLFTGWLTKPARLSTRG
ncbi:MAG: hypothetical protein HXY21_05215 [Parvularculaceae bacterium]|nr:hypothetical protein [Parvularculaceae bacterium]